MDDFGGSISRLRSTGCLDVASMATHTIPVPSKPSFDTQNGYRYFSTSIYCSSNSLGCFFFFLPISIFYLNMLLEKQFFLLNSSFKSVPGRFVPGCYTLAVSEALPEDLQV